MNGLKISFAVVAFVLVQGIGVIWYISKLDSRVDQMYKSFEEENRKKNRPLTCDNTRNSSLDARSDKWDRYGNTSRGIEQNHF